MEKGQRQFTEEEIPHVLTQKVSVEYNHNEKELTNQICKIKGDNTQCLMGIKSSICSYCTKKECKLVQSLPQSNSTIFRLEQYLSSFFDTYLCLKQSLTKSFLLHEILRDNLSLFFSILHHSSLPG